jgi:hypothetical protein
MRAGSASKGIKNFYKFFLGEVPENKTITPCCNARDSKLQSIPRIVV